MKTISFFNEDVVYDDIRREIAQEAQQPASPVDCVEAFIDIHDAPVIKWYQQSRICDEIIAKRTPIETHRKKFLCGVYFLFDAIELRYIGQSTNVNWRVWQHRQQGRDFDRVAVLPCKREWLSEVEAYFILSLEPPDNRVVPPNTLFRSSATLKRRLKKTQAQAEAWIDTNYIQRIRDDYYIIPLKKDDALI